MWIFSEDGWWTAQNNDGETGLVPSNFLAKYHDDATNTPSDVTETNEETCENDDVADDEVISEVTDPVIVVPKKLDASKEYVSIMW